MAKASMGLTQQVENVMSDVNKLKKDMTTTTANVLKNKAEIEKLKL